MVQWFHIIGDPTFEFPGIWDPKFRGDQGSYLRRAYPAPAPIGIFRGGFSNLSDFGRF